MEEKDVQRLIDMLYNMIDEAKSAAFSAEKCTINRDEALDILDEMRSKLPLELKKAKELIAARNDYVAGAKKEVEKMMRQAELDAKTIVSESEVIQQARQKSGPRSAAASCTAWPTPIPRTLCAARRRPFRPHCPRCRPPVPSSAPPRRSRCRPPRIT